MSSAIVSVFSIFEKNCCLSNKIFLPIYHLQEVNPRYILRNWVAQEAIQRAEQDDFSEVQFLYKLLRNPYRINHEAEQRGYASPPPEWSKKLAVSCSS